MPETRFDSASAAEDAYYSAFERADVAAMRGVWDDSDQIECIHPMGPRLRGAEVLASWAEMFSAPQYAAIQRSDPRRYEGPELTVHIVLENILFRDGSQKPLQIIATNIYRRTPNGWRMVGHHASPAPGQPRGAGGSTALH